MRLIVLAAVSTLALAGCGSSNVDANGDGKISVEEAAAKSKDIVKPEPGKYRNSVEILNMEMPGAPKEMQDMIKQRTSAGPQVSEYCLTKEEADKGFEEMAKKAQEDDACSFEKFEAEGGRIDAVMNCSAPGRGTARITLNGTGTKTSSDMTMTMETKPESGPSMKMSMKSTQERIGDCDK
jgi:hypothetical protein